MADYSMFHRAIYTIFFLYVLCRCLQIVCILILFETGQLVLHLFQSGHEPKTYADPTVREIHKIELDQLTSVRESNKKGDQLITAWPPPKIPSAEGREKKKENSQRKSML